MAWRSVGELKLRLPTTIDLLTASFLRRAMQVRELATAAPIRQRLRLAHVARIRDVLLASIGPVISIRAEDLDQLDAALSELSADAHGAARQPLAGGLVAMLAAEALDLAYGHLFAGCFERRSIGPLEIKPGEPIPLVTFDLQRLFGYDRKLSTHPTRRDSFALDHTEHLAFRSEARDGKATIKVVLDFDLADALPAPEPNFKLAAMYLGGLVDPTTSKQTPRDIDVVVHPRPDSDYGNAFVVLPRDELANAELMRQLSLKAQNCKVHLAIAPELSSSSRAVQEVAGLASGTLVVCGTSHVEINGAHRNRCTTVIRGVRRIHDKFNVFSDPAGRFEDIEPGPPELRILMVHDRTRDQAEQPTIAWSYAVVICKDFLQDDVQEALRDLQPAMVMVPALAPDLQVFRQLAEGLVAHAQTIVVVVNHEGTPGFVVRPLRGAEAVMHLKPPASETLEEIMIFD